MRLTSQTDGRATPEVIDPPPTATTVHDGRVLNWMGSEEVATSTDRISAATDSCARAETLLEVAADLVRTIARRPLDPRGGEVAVDDVLEDLAVLEDEMRLRLRRLERSVAEVRRCAAEAARTADAGSAGEHPDRYAAARRVLDLQEHLTVAGQACAVLARYLSSAASLSEALREAETTTRSAARVGACAEDAARHARWETAR